MFAAGYQMQGQNVATDFLEKILSRKCKIHQKLPCDFIHLIPSEFSPRLCCKCMEVRKIPFNDVISIRLLLEASSFSIFNAYPKFTDNSITQKIQDLQDSNSNDRIESDLQNFFNKLNSTVSQAIEKVKYEQKQKLSSLSNSYQDVFNSLAKISQIEPFQELVKNQNLDENKLKTFIQQQHLQLNNYTEMMNNKLLKYLKIEKSFSLSDANNRLQSIVELINGITFFSTRETNQLQLQQSIFQQQNQSQQPVQQHQLPIQQTVLQHQLPIQYTVQQHQLPIQQTVLQHQLPIQQTVQQHQLPIQYTVQQHQLPIQQTSQQQQQLQYQQQLRKQEQKIQQLREQDRQQNTSFSKSSDYDYYCSLREKRSEKLPSYIKQLPYDKYQWEKLSQKQRDEKIQSMKDYFY